MYIKDDKNWWKKLAYKKLSPCCKFPLKKVKFSSDEYPNSHYPAELYCGDDLCGRAFTFDQLLANYPQNQISDLPTDKHMIEILKRGDIKELKRLAKKRYETEKLKYVLNKNKIKPDNKIYEALMIEKETRQHFKEKKPQGMTNTEYLELLLSKK